MSSVGRRTIQNLLIAIILRNFKLCFHHALPWFCIKHESSAIYIGFPVGLSIRRTVYQADSGVERFSITPNQLSVSVGGEIQIHVANKGIVGHNFYTMQHGVDIGDMFDDGDIANAYWDVDVQPDDSVKLSITAPEKPGTY